MTNPIHRIIAILSLFVLINVSVLAKNKLFFNQTKSLETNHIKILSVEAGAGSLKITSKDTNEIEVKAKIYSDDYTNMDDLKKAFDDKMEFKLEKIETQIVLKAKNKNRLFFWSSPNIQIDLEIFVPLKMNLIVDDGSGSITINNISGSIELGDGSGSIEMNHITGNVSIDDGSGAIEINQITGNLSIEDGSGSINVTDLIGEFILIDDGSGSIKVNGKEWYQ